MPQLLVRDLDAGTVERLDPVHVTRRQIGDNDLVTETGDLTDEAMSEASSVAEEWQRNLAGGVHADSAEAIRQDRER